MVEHYTLKVFIEDDETVWFEVSTDPDHPHPYLHLPEDIDQGDVDLLKGKALVGEVALRIIDPQTGADQSERWLTALLGVPPGGPAEGHSAINGRRGLLTQGSRVVMDGVATGVRLSDSFAGFHLGLRDIRERHRRQRLFARTGTSTVLPRGVLNGYGKLPNGEWLVPPTRPLLATWYGGESIVGPVGYFDLSSYWRGDYAIQSGRSSFPPELAYTNAMRETATAQNNVGRYDRVAILWRPAVGGSWTVIDRPYAGIPWHGGGVGSIIQRLHSNLLNVWSGKLHGAGERDGEPGEGIYSIGCRPSGTEPLPADGQNVQVIVLYIGEPNEDYPFHYEGTAGEFLRRLYAGEYSPRDAGGALRPIMRNIDEPRLLGLDRPIRVRLTETPAADKSREWIESAYQQLIAAAGLTREGKLAPITSKLPPPDEVLPEITDENAVPIPGWEHPTSNAVTSVVVKYHRDFIVPAEEDPHGEWSAGDGIASREIVVERRAPEWIVDLMGEHAHEIEGTMFRALGGEDGNPVSGLEDEAGWQLAVEAANEVMDRWLFGGQTSFCRLARSAFPDLEPGDWVIDRRSWRPNYREGKRGGASLAQIVNIRQVSEAYIEVRLIDAGPDDQPLSMPTIGQPTIENGGVISVPVTAVPSGGEVAVYYATGETAPPLGSGEWRLIGRIGEPGVVTTPIVSSGVRVWVTARAEGAGRRPSLFLAPQSVVVPNVPRVLRVRVEIDDNGAATAYWTPGLHAAGVRVYYEAHDPDAEPDLTAYVDVPAEDGSVELPVIVAPGKTVTVDVEPWTGWTGSAVSGLAGPRRTASASREPEPGLPEGAKDPKVTLIPPFVLLGNALYFVVAKDWRGETAGLEWRYTYWWTHTEHPGWPHYEPMDNGAASFSVPQHASYPTNVEVQIRDAEGRTMRASAVLNPRLPVIDSSGGLVDDAVGESQIQENAVQSRHIGAEQVTAGKIKAGAVDTIHLAAESVVADKIAAGAVEAGHIAADAVEAEHIAADAVEADHISAGAVEARHLAAGSVTAEKIKAGEVDTVHLAAGSVTAEKIKAGEVDTVHLAAESVTAEKIKAGEVETVHLAAGSVTAEKIKAGEVDTVHLAADSVTAEKIKAGEVDTVHLAAGSVTAEKIKAGEVETVHLAAGSVTAEKIKAGEITSDHLEATTLSGLFADLGDITAGVIRDAEARFHIDVDNRLIRIRDAQNPPQTRVEIGRLGGGASQWGLRVWDDLGKIILDATGLGVDVVGTDQIAGGAITETKIADDAITAPKIRAGAIEASKLSITDWSNLVANGSFATGDLSEWLASEPSQTDVLSREDAGVPAGAPTDYVVRMPLVASNRYIHALDGEEIDVVSGERYVASVFAASSPDANGPGRFYVRFRAPNSELANTTRTRVIQTTGGEWEEHTYVIEVPEGYTKLRFSLRTDNTASPQGHWFFAGVRLRKAVGSVLIEDGAVHAQHVAAGEIHGDHIKSGEITTSHLNFVPTGSNNIIARINASTEQGGTLRIEGRKIQIDGSVTFASGYDPSEAMDFASDTQGARNRLVNGGFESGEAYWYNHGSSGTQFDVLAEAGRGGGRAARLFIPAGATQIVVSQSPNREGGSSRRFRVTPGDVVKFGGWIRRVSGTGRCRFRLARYDADGNVINYAHSDVLPPDAGSSDYHFVLGTHTIPEGVHYIAFALQVDQATTDTTAYFDDVFFALATGSVLIENGAITADHINVGTLDAITVDAGTITAGRLRNPANTAGIRLNSGYTRPGSWARYIDFAGSGSDPFIKHDALELRHNGEAVFSGEVASTSFTADWATFQSMFFKLDRANAPVGLSVSFRSALPGHPDYFPVLSAGENAGGEESGYIGFRSDEMEVRPAAGKMTMHGRLTAYNSTSRVYLDTPATGTLSRGLGFRRDGQNLWMVYVDGPTNFRIMRYDDLGSNVGDAMKIDRATGVTTFGGAVVAETFYKS